MILAVVLFAAETTVGIWLIVRQYDVWWRRYAATFFLCFSIIHLNLLFSGQIVTCGCFGMLQGNAITNLFDTPSKAIVLNLMLALTLLRFDFKNFSRIITARKPKTYEIKNDQLY